MDLTLIGGIIFVLVLGLVAVAFWRDSKLKGELRQRGVTVNALVMDRAHEVRHDTDDNNITTTTDLYYISYRYAVNGTNYTRREGVSRDVHDALLQGQMIQVVYLPEKPAEARMASAL